MSCHGAAEQVVFDQRFHPGWNHPVKTLGLIQQMKRMTEEDCCCPACWGNAIACPDAIACETD